MTLTQSISLHIPRSLVAFTNQCRRAYCCIILTAFLLSLSTTSFAGLTQEKIGIFPSYANAEGVQAFKDFENWLGNQLSFVTMNINRVSWSDFESSSRGIFTNPTAWRNVPYARPCITVPLNVGSVDARTDQGISQISEDLTKVANGDFDAHYRKIAADIVEAGFANAIIRLGHEGDFLGYSHSFRGGNYAEYIAAFQHIHDVLLSVPGAQFLFDYTSNGGFLKYGALGYPGDAYVDILGLDFYDKAPWPNIEAKLQAHLDFAISRGKPVSYPEFGLDDPSGCTQTNPNFCAKGDNPEFIENVFNWLDNLPSSGPGSLVYANYFNGSSTANTHNLDRYPSSKAKFKQLFGNLPVAGSSTSSGDNTSTVNIQFDTININHQWQSINFTNPFTNAPIVVVRGVSKTGGEAVISRIRNVTTSGFEVRLQEWDEEYDSDSGAHTFEKVGYIAVEPGNHTLNSGAQIQAGTKQLTIAEGQKWMSYENGIVFNNNPVLFSSIVGYSASQPPISVGQGSSSIYGFFLRLFVSEKDGDSANYTGDRIEDISYIAWTPSSGDLDGWKYLVSKRPNQNHQLQKIGFGNRFTNTPHFIGNILTSFSVDPANVRWIDRGANSIRVQVHEEKTFDAEIEHDDEVIGFIAIGK